MAANASSFLSEEQYLARDRAASTRSEYHDGEVVAMAGGNFRHATIIGNVARNLGNKLQASRWRVLSQDMRVWIPSARVYTYPDILVYCGQPRFADEKEDTLLNPVVIVEVLSDTTRDYDLGSKFDMYRTVPTLLEYITVDTWKAHVISRLRQEDGTWLLRDYMDADLGISFIAFDNNAQITVGLNFTDIYQDVQFSVDS